MYLSALYSSSDNLFKFLFIGGLTLIVTALVYPLQKEQILELEVNAHDQSAELWNAEADNIQKQISEMRLEAKRVEENIDSLISLREKAQKSEKNKLTLKIESEKQTILKDYDSLKRQKIELNTKHTIIKYNSEKIEILKKHLAEYSSYTSWMLWVGCILTFVGLCFWAYSTSIELKSKYLELKEKQNTSLNEDGNTSENETPNQ